MSGDTKDRILEVAYEIILRKGYPAATVDEICKAAEVSKGSFYHFFKTKEDMGLALLAAFYEESQRRLFEADWTALTDPEQKLLGLLSYTEGQAEAFWGEGCLLGGLAIDVAETNEAMQQKVSTIFGSLAQRIAPAFEPAVAPGGPSAQELAQQYLATIEGAIVLAKAHRDPAHIGRAIAVFADYIRRLLAQTQTV